MFRYVKGGEEKDSAGQPEHVALIYREFSKFSGHHSANGDSLPLALSSAAAAANPCGIYGRSQLHQQLKGSG